MERDKIKVIVCRVDERAEVIEIDDKDECRIVFIVVTPSFF